MLLLGSAHQDNWAQRWGFGILGIAASLVLIAVSGAMNFQFGESLGRTPASGQIYAWASVAADMFKVLSPFFIAAAWRARSWNWAIACGLVWVITAAYGTLSAAGHAALNRADTSGTRVIKANTYSDNSAALERAQKELGWVPPHRPAGVVLSEMTGMKSKPQWVWSSQCARPDGRDQEKFCHNYYKLKGEAESAEGAQKLEARITELMASRAGADAASIAGGDPQADNLAKLTNLDLSTINFALILMVILLLETGSGLGMFVSVKYLTGGQKGGPAFVDKTPTPPEEQAEVSILPPPEPTAAPRLLAAPLTRPDPSIEGRAVLERIGWPKTRPGHAQEREGRDVLGLRWLAWLSVHNLGGHYTHEKVSDLYVEYCDAQNMEPWKADRVSKTELASIHRGRRYYAWSSGSPVTWTIQTPSMDELHQLLDKAGFPAVPKASRKAEKVDPRPAPEPQVEETTPDKGAAPGPNRPFSSGTETPRPPAKLRGPIKGLAELQRVNIEAMRNLVRQQKAHWQSKAVTPRRKSLNRMWRSRAA